MTPSNDSPPTDSRQPQDDNPDPSAPPGQSSIPSSPTASTPGSEGYPSWLPKRPPHPAPGSTLRSLSTNVMFGPDAGPATDLPTGSAHDSEHVQVTTTPQPPAATFSGGRKPTPRSVRIVSMQDSSPGGGAGMVSRRETDQTTRTPDATHSHAHPRLRAAAIAAAAAAAAASAAQPKFRSPGLHLELLRDPSWKTRFHFYLFPLLVFAHIPIQTFLDFNAVFMLIQVARFPNPDAPGVPGSGRNWALGAIAYVASWTIWFFIVFLGYELFYSFYRRWRFRRPLILPIYLSSPAFNLVSMTSYNHFCFLQHIRNSAFPHVNPSAVLPSAEGSLRDALAETCYFYAQNLPTVVTLLPRAGLALALLLAFFSPEHLPGGLTLSDVDQSIARRDGTYFDQSTGSLSGYAKGVLIANAAWTAWRTLVLLFSWVGLWIFSGHGCAGLCGPRSRLEEEEFGRSASIYSEKSETGAFAGASGTEQLPWSWKECTLLRVQEAYDFCLTLRAPRQSRMAGQQHPQESGFDGIEKVFAAVGLGGATTQPPQGRRGMLSQDLFESPGDAPSRKSTPAIVLGQGQGQDVVSPLPEAHVRETTIEGGQHAPIKNLPYPFPGFGPRESSEQEQIPFPPSPGIPDNGEDGDQGGEEEGEGNITVEVDDEGEVEFEEEDLQPRTSEEPSSFSGRASNSLSSLGQPIPSRYPFSFRHPARGGSISSTGSPPFAFSRAAATPKSKSTSTRASRETRSTGNADTTTSPSSSPSAGSPVSVVAPSSSSHSPQDNVRGMPMPPRHPAAGASGRQRAGTVPIPMSPTPVGALTTTRPRQQPASLDEQQLHIRTESVGSGSDREDEHVSRSGQPSPDGSLEAREREDSVGLLSPSPPSSQSSPRVSLGSRNGSAASLARISGAFRPRSRSRHTSSGSGTGSGVSSRHDSHVSLSSVSLALGGHRVRAHSLIQSIAGASRSSVELVLGRTPSSQAGAVRLGEAYDVEADASASDGGALSNPENYTFGLPVVGGAGTALPRRAGMRAHTLESVTARSPPISPVSSVSVPSSPSVRNGVALRLAAGAPASRARTASSSGSSASSQQRAALANARARAGLQPARSFASEQGSPPSILTRSARSDGSTQTQTQQPPTSTPAGVPIPQPQSQAEAHPDVSTAAASLVTTPPTIASETTDSSGRTPQSLGVMEHLAPPHTRNFMPR